MVHAAQIDLIDDDPRVAPQKGPLAELIEFVQASKEMRGLITTGQAAKILSVPTSQVSVWVSRGRLSSRSILGARMVSAAEVLALFKERTEEGIRKSGGRGIKAPCLSGLAEAAWDDIDPTVG